jgi:hypothetical protein
MEATNTHKITVQHENNRMQYRLHAWCSVDQLSHHQRWRKRINSVEGTFVFSHASCIFLISPHSLSLITFWLNTNPRTNMPSKGALISFSVAILAIIITCTTTNIPTSVFKACYYMIHPYQAILDSCEGPGEFEYGEYAVKLIPGHSLTDHSAAIGTDIEVYIVGFNPHNNFFDMRSILYYTKDVSEELFSAIRADRGVYLIGCSKIQRDFGLDPDTESFLKKMQEMRQSRHHAAESNDEGESVDGR